jgi:C4-dicarboxylate transporter DctM subunit
MSIEEVIVAALPWLMILLSVLIIVTYVPAVSMLLTRFM